MYIQKLFSTGLDCKKRSDSLPKKAERLDDQGLSDNQYILISTSNGDKEEVTKTEESTEVFSTDSINTVPITKIDETMSEETSTENQSNNDEIAELVPEFEIEETTMSTEGKHQNG